MKKMLFEITAQGDTIYARATDGREVVKVLERHHMWPLPTGVEGTIRVIEESELPEGEEPLE